MLTAKKSKWFERVFTIYNRNLLKRRFHSLNVYGMGNLLKKNSNFPLVIYSNHSSWWDGLVIFEVLKRFDFEFYVMMEEKQLKDLQLFRKLGAFSVIRENPREGIKSINYAVKLLKQNVKSAVLIFPQGRIYPNDLRPLEFFNGVSKILEKTENCNYVSFSLKYEFLTNFKPEIYINIGKIKLFEKSKKIAYKKLTNDLELETTFNLNELKACFLYNSFDGFENLF